MAKKKFSSDIWDLLRIIWEMTPEITFNALLAEAVKKTGFDLSEFPTKSAISRRAKTEEWKKSSKRIATLSGKQLILLIKKLLNDTAKLKNEKNEKKPQDNDLNNKNSEIHDKSKNKNAVAISTFSENENLQDTPALERLSTALIIKKNRNRSFRLGNLVDETIESVYHIRDEVLALDFDEKTAPEVIETKIALVNYKMKIINQLVSINLNQSITLVNIANCDTKFWGLEIDDLKDLDELKAKRTAHVEGAENRLREAKERMKLKHEEALKRQDNIFEKAEQLARTGEITDIDVDVG